MKSKVILLGLVWGVLMMWVVGCGKVQDKPELNQGSPEIAFFFISPVDVNIDVDSSIQFTISAKDKDGNSLEASPIWSITNDIGEISSAGVFTAKNIGSGSVNATFNSLTASVAVTVTDKGGVNYLAIHNQWVSPNGDGNNDTARIDYSLNQKKNLALKIYGLAGESIGPIYQGEADGFNRLTWDGKLLGSSQIVSDGKYLIKIVVDGVETTKYVNVIIDTTKPDVSISSDPRIISPNDDGTQESTRLNYQISDNLSPQVDTSLLQYKVGRIVNVLWNGHGFNKLGEQQTIEWNGKLGTIQFVDQGKFICKLNAIDLAGNSNSATCEVIVDTKPPRIENAIVDNPYFSPNGDGLKDAASVSFYLSDEIFNEIKVTAIIKDASSREVVTLKNKEIFIGGNGEEKSIVWDGKNSSGNTVGNGGYTFNLFAEDDAANISSTIVVPVNVDM